MTIQTNDIEYDLNGASFTGYIAHPAEGQRCPAVIVVHEWWGINDYIKSRVEQLANEGYVALAVDMYGTGNRASNPEQAAEFMNSTFASADIIPERFDAGVELLKQQNEVDQSKIAAMGYCYGGAVVLNMARAGKPLKAVASFHGLLATDAPMQQGVFEGEIAVFNGADDPMVSADILNAFKEEMSDAKVHHTIISYPGVVHGFTNPGATERGKKYSMPLAYDEQADTASWKATMLLFDRVMA